MRNMNSKQAAPVGACSIRSYLQQGTPAIAIQCRLKHSVSRCHGWGIAAQQIMAARNTGH